MAGEKVCSGHISNQLAELELMHSDAGMVFFLRGVNQARMK